MALTLLRNGTVLLADGWKRTDVWLAQGGVLAIGDAPPLPQGTGAEVDEISCEGRRIVPGFIDGHLHVLGGGGGWSTRIPELPVDAALEAGITACVAMPGVDNVSRSLHGLIAVARAYTEQGVEALAMTGGFAWPPQPLTGSIRTDIHLIPELVGVKIALGEHLATAPALDELVQLLRELEWAGRMTGASALLHVHLGTSARPSSPLPEALAAAGTSPRNVQVTHANYTPETLRAAIELGLEGCWVDVNPLLNPGRVAGAVSPVDAIRELISAGVAPDRLTLSSDGNASVPRVLPDGETERFSHQLGLLPAVRDVVDAGVLSEPEAFALVTRNPAAAHGRPDWGGIHVDAAANLVVISDDRRRIDTVISGGVVRVDDGRAVSPSPFRDPRWRA